MIQSFSNLSSLTISPEMKLPLLVMSRYLFFLTRRPISQSNAHYAQKRIHGLKSLSEPLEEMDFPRARQIVRLLRMMEPQNLQETARRLQLTIQPLTETSLPQDYLALNQPLQTAFWTKSHRILLLLGPAIGIGDEIITFPLPSLIKKINPDAEIVILSAYRHLWEDVCGVDEVHHYDTYLTIVQAIQGELALGKFDLVILLDFESPDLHQLVCRDTAVTRYIELSLGARCCYAVDNEKQWVHLINVPSAYFGNYYAGFDFLLKRIGLELAPKDRFTAAKRTYQPDDKALRIYVSPFTSKYDPSLLYWSRLLSALLPETPARPIQFIIEPGPNLTTWRFATDLAKATSAQIGNGAICQVARGENGRFLPLPEVFAEITKAHLVICADSFTAHAAPALGRTALVLASQGLEDWRVPSPTSFYFSAENPLSDIVSGMQQILSHFGVESLASYHWPQVTESEQQLLSAISQLRDLLNQEENYRKADIQNAYHQFIQTSKAVTRRLPYWPARTMGLLGDFQYETPFHQLPADDNLTPSFQPDLVHYIDNCWQIWQNTNLHKYIMLMSGESKA